MEVEITAIDIPGIFQEKQGDKDSENCQKISKVAVVILPRNVWPSRPVSFNVSGVGLKDTSSYIIFKSSDFCLIQHAPACQNNILNSVSISICLFTFKFW